MRPPIMPAKPAAAKLVLVYSTFLALLGLALRFGGAGGDLWEDEIHNLVAAGGIHRWHEVFWHINSDNNHMLNTLWLFCIGPGHQPMVLRLEAIVFGVLSIPAAGWAAYGGRRSDTIAAIAAMALTAILYPSVHYGSEARGYAGMMLASFLAIGLAERGLRTRSSQACLGAATLFGVLSYSYAMFPVAVLGLWRSVIVRRQGEDWFASVARAAIPFRWAIIAVAVPFVLIHVGNMHHTFQHGGSLSAHPFAKTGGAILQFFDLVFGIPDGPIPWAGAAASLACILIALQSPSRAVRRRSGYFALLMGVYVAYLIAIGAKAGLDHARYAMPLLAPLILVMADCAALGLRRGRVTRACTIILLVALFAGTGDSLARFYGDGRGHYSDAIMAMTENGPATFASDQPYGHGHADVIEFLNRRLGRPITYVPLGDTCVMTPDWLLVSSDAARFQTLDYGLPGCTATYANPRQFPYWGLAGWDWTLYRRVR